ncbi:hypothetical protein HMPREF3208_01411 [Gardnerella vaginalis]|uniref:Uncharacterized protein n=1 Tax=Gardnerella vaginalis TaxID=2702 RepID=A0A133NNT9_GARVA|nr:hypothetical protein HMPREF3208_01411 [Gardnerella vaginalis]
MIDLRSAWIPAPPVGSVPAMESTRGMIGSSSDGNELFRGVEKAVFAVVFAVVFTLVAFTTEVILLSAFVCAGIVIMFPFASTI